MAKRFTFVVIAGLLALSGCTVHQANAPSTAQVGGTSTFALSLDMTATPDSISQDGSSQSSVVVTAHDHTGKPESGVPIRLDMSVNGVTQDFGTLSARSLVTGSDGTAKAVYTAPSTSPIAGGSGTMISIIASASGTNAQASNGATVGIRLVPPGVILPPAETPVAQFTVTPTPINFNIPATFDASTSCAVPLSAGVCQSAIPGTPTADTIVSYAWNFGDGATASGKIVSHTYVASTTPGTSFNATLTVTNERGLAASTTQVLSVNASPAPSVAWTFSPTTPNVGDTVLFNADATRAAAGHTIVEYSWNFGDQFSTGSNTASGFQATHVFTVKNTYNVVLTVLDDAGQKATLLTPVTVGDGSPTAKFTFAITDPLNHTVTVDGSGSTATGTATIKDYKWTWGDGTSTDSGTTAVATHPFAAAGPYSITLTVTDTLNRTSSASLSVTVP